MCEYKCPLCICVRRHCCMNIRVALGRLFARITITKGPKGPRRPYTYAICLHTSTSKGTGHWTQDTTGCRSSSRTSVSLPSYTNKLISARHSKCLAHWATFVIEYRWGTRRKFHSRNTSQWVKLCKTNYDYAMSIALSMGTPTRNRGQGVTIMRQMTRGHRHSLENSITWIKIFK